MIVVAAVVGVWVAVSLVTIGVCVYTASWDFDLCECSDPDGCCCDEVES